MALSLPTRIHDDAGQPQRTSAMVPKTQVVADVMSIDPIVVSVNASLEEADFLLRSAYIRGIPVVDGDGALVGVLSHAHLAAYRFAYRQASIERMGSAGRRATDEPS